MPSPKSSKSPFHKCHQLRILSTSSGQSTFNMDREYFQHAVEEATSSTLHIISRTITIFTYGIIGVYVLSVTIPAKFPSVVMDELPGGVYADWLIYGCDWAWLAWIWYIDHGEFLRKRWMMRRNRSDVGGRSCSLQQETRHGRQGGTKQANWTSPNEIDRARQVCSIGRW